MANVLKIKSGEQVIRILLPEGEPTYEAVEGAIRQVDPNGTTVAKYRDDENDLCTLCPPNFSDFVAMSGELNGRIVLRLELFTRTDSTPAISTNVDEVTMASKDAGDAGSEQPAAAAP